MEALSGRLSWWKHNRHLTLAFNKEQRRFLGGVFFRRLRKASQISPVYVSSNADCAELLLTFLSYCRRIAEEIEEERKSKQGHPNEEVQGFKDLLREACQIGHVAKIPPGLRERCQKLIETLSGFAEH